MVCKYPPGEEPVSVVDINLKVPTSYIPNSPVKFLFKAVALSALTIARFPSSKF